MGIRSPLLQRLNPAFILLVVWIAVTTITWFSATPSAGETPRLKGIAFGIGGLAGATGDLVIRYRSKQINGWWRFFASETGGYAYGLPAWLFGLAGLATGVAFALRIIK